MRKNIVVLDWNWKEITVNVWSSVTLSQYVSTDTDPLRGPGISSIPRQQAHLISKHQSLLKRNQALGEMFAFRAGEGKIPKCAPNILCQKEK